MSVEGDDGPCPVNGWSQNGLLHSALLYHDTEEFLAAAVSFLRIGLTRGEAVMAVLPGPRLDLLRTALGPMANAVRLLDMTEVGRNPGRILPWVLQPFVTEHPARRIRVIGEPIWPDRSPLEYPACVQHEALVNLALAGRRITVLCPYDVSRLSPQALTDAMRTHPVLAVNGGWKPSDQYTSPERLLPIGNQPFAAPPATATPLVFDADRLPLVRQLVADRAHAAGFSPQRVAELQMAVNEVATNSIVHGPGHGSLLMWQEETHLVCQVSDEGHITDPLAGRILPPPHSGGGRGLALVHYLCDLVRIHSEPSGTTIRMYMQLPVGVSA